MVLPWQEVVEVCRKYGVLSLVDGAHSIGQHKVDVGASKCDFFVTVSRIRGIKDEAETTECS